MPTGVNAPGPNAQHIPPSRNKSDRVVQALVPVGFSAPDPEKGTRRVHRDGQKASWWLLPQQELPGHVATDAEDEIDESLRRLAELYPPATPLDDL
jgi:hypothetical protein